MKKLTNLFTQMFYDVLIVFALLAAFLTQAVPIPFIILGFIYNKIDDGTFDIKETLTEHTSNIILQLLYSFVIWYVLF